MAGEEAANDQAQAAEDATAPTTADGADAEGSEAEPKEPERKERTFSREEVDRTVKNRIDRAREKHEAQLKDAEEKLAEAQAEAEKAKAEAEELKAQAQRAEMVAKAAKDADVPEAVIELLKGDTAEELAKAAKAVKEALPKVFFPKVEEEGGQNPPATREDILAIKDTAKRIQAMGAHPELFRKNL